jgi:hypothetical protein
MTIINPLSPTPTPAFHATQSAQRKQGGPVQFSLPPIDHKAAPPGAGASGPPRSTGRPPLTPLPIGSIAGLTPPNAAPPKTPTLNQLPIATPVGSISELTQAGATPPNTAAATPPNQGNLVTARLISRLYQQPGG